MGRLLAKDKGVRNKHSSLFWSFLKSFIVQALGHIPITMTVPSFKIQKYFQKWKFFKMVGVQLLAFSNRPIYKF